ncbi:MAG: peptidylprolyl isomerase [Melioribacteraceae bacterium]|jgi:FKBP-type peptidyl-prolyl cis-trans isomerase SlyD|nr:peptidylprolyl isomerase [Melioribacteraceae bacterium]MCO6474953.1 peptidylprolyl isomerase [Melioribacteraceae bacterium]MDD3556943.1 peptidylprolyl isomerase [Melioribacteraceae bacterium]
MQIANDKVVSIHYTLKDNDGKILDSSEGKEPLKYIQGKQNIIPGLENAMEGKSVGDKFNVKVQPNEGYGERNDQMVVSIPKTSFGEIKEINPGMQFQLNSQNGPVVVTVVETDDENVKVDANHPLAGVELNFDVEVMDIREATSEELDHGHVH